MSETTAIILSALIAVTLMAIVFTIITIFTPKYKLEITTKDGTKTIRHATSMSELDEAAIYLCFAPRIKMIEGMKKSWHFGQWKTVFKYGE